MRHRWGLGAVIIFVLLASCSLPRPSVDLKVGGVDIPGSAEGSYCQSGGCSGVCGDTIAPVAPLTTVRATAPVVLEFLTGADVNQINVNIFAGDRYGGQAAIESFSLKDGERRQRSSAMRNGHYYIVVGIGWSRLLDRGDTSRAFLIDLAPP